MEWMAHNTITDVLANRYFVAVGVPLLLILMGAIARKLVRGTRWVRQDFYLGIDLALAALSSGLIYLYEIVQLMRQGPPPPGSPGYEHALLAATGFIIVSLVALMLMLGLHQDEERAGLKPIRQFLSLGVLGNAASGGLLAMFILLVKGVPVA
jgi:hypothetical protein